MTETTVQNDDAPAPQVGRNDPCPCGSGQKYKKCCMNADRVQKEASKSSREPHELIGEHTSPWDMYKLLVTVRESNMPKFFWEATHELGPWRARYPTAEGYFEGLGGGSVDMVAREGTDLLRIRHDGPDVMLLLVRNNTAEVVTLRPNEVDAAGASREVEHWGWRVWDVAYHPFTKSTDEPTFESLGYTWAPAAAK